MKVPFLDLKAEYAALRDEILEAVDRVGRSSAYILGEEVESFEREFAAYCGARFCVGLNSGTSALHLGLLALGVQPGDEVITTPNTFLATVEAILYCGARPVLVDIDPSTANLDVRLIESAITLRTRAILPIHLYGRPADMDAIREIAAPRGIRILEDAAQSHGAKYRGRRVGSLGNPAIFSFYPTKNIGAHGEGGAIVTDDESVDRFARVARAHGATSRYYHEMIGYNYRMEGIQAAILRIKLRRLDDWTRKRREFAALYRRRLLETFPELPLNLLADDPRDESVFHQFAVYVPKRDCLMKLLAEREIETAVHYPTPLHLQPACSSLGYPAGTFPHSECACERVLSLPIHPWLSTDQVEFVAQSVREILSAK